MIKLSKDYPKTNLWHPKDINEKKHNEHDCIRKTKKLKW